MLKKVKAGFSLMEVNMAIFVMAVGILSAVALFPLGLRESTQGQADITQAMFSDYLLNQAVAAASLTNFPWSQWKSLPNVAERENSGILPSVQDNVPTFMKNRIKLPMGWGQDRFRMICCLVPGASDKIMGIMVQSTEVKGGKITDYTNNPVYYAEAIFQGDPTQ